MSTTLPLNKLVKNRDKHLKDAKHPEEQGKTDLAQRSRERAAEWQKEIDKVMADLPRD